MSEYEFFPHCNSEVLHAPGECVYCDEHPVRQRMREASNTPFSPLEANGWRGNVAWTPQMVADQAAFWAEARDSYVAEEGGTGELPPLH